MAVANSDILVVQKNASGLICKTTVADLLAGAGGGGSEVIISDTPPDPTGYPEGTLWWNSSADDLSLYVLYNDPAPDAGKKWIDASPPGGSSGGSEVIVSDTAPDPAGLDEGTLWWNSDSTDTSLYVLYNDPNPDAGLKWVEASPATGGDSGGGGGTDPGAVRLNDGGLKQVIQSGGLGISDGTTENITLNSDGSATFASGILSGDVPSASTTNLGTEISGDGVIDTRVGASSAAIKVRESGSGATNITLSGDGNASFAGYVESDLFSVSRSAVANKDNYVSKLAVNDTGKHFKAVDAGANTVASIDANGGGTFTSSVTVGEVSSSTPFSQMVVGSVQARPATDTDSTFVGYTNSGAAPSFSVSGQGQANFGVGADWAGGFFNIRKRDNNWAQMISIDSTSTAPTALFIGCGADAPQGGAKALLVTKGHTALGGSATADTVVIDWSGNAQFAGAVQSFAPSTSLFAAAGAAADGSTPVFVVRHSATAPTNGTDAFYVYSNGTYTTVSDQNQKKNIETTRDGYLEDLNKLRVVKYNWKSQDEGDVKELGLIAQEVQEVFPGLVAPMGEDEDGETISGIKSSVLPFMLLKALQEADDKIEALEARLAELEKRFS